MNRGLGAITCAFILLSTVCRASDSITFTFNPPDGLMGAESYKFSRVMEFAGTKHTDVTIRKEAMSFTRNPDSFLVSVTPVSSEAIHDGRRVEGDGNTQRLVSIVEQAPITYQLNRGGICVRVFGIDEFIKTMGQRASNAASQQAVASIRNCQDVLKVQAINDWNELIAPFTSRTVRIGDVWKTTLGKPMGVGGDMTASAKYKFLGWVNCGGRPCVKVRVALACVDTAALKKYLSGLYSRMATTGVQRAQMPQLTKVSVRDTEERIIDPSTMLYHRDVMTVDMKVTFALSGYGQKTLTIKQTIDRQFSYTAPVVASR